MLQKDKNMAGTEFKPRYLQRFNKPFPGSGITGPFSLPAGFSEAGERALTGILEVDDMGYAEFEYGALPVAFKEVQANAANLRFGKMEMPVSCPRRDWDPVVAPRHTTFYIIAPADIYRNVIDFVLTEAGDALPSDKPYWLKTPSSMREAVWGDNERCAYAARRVGWMDLQLGFFVFTDATMFEGIKAVFGVTQPFVQPQASPVIGAVVAALAKTR